MAKVVSPLHSGSARGRLGNLVYGGWHGIEFVRNYTAPDFSTPDPRAAQMLRVGLANAAWKLLSDFQREGWHDYARRRPRVDCFGTVFCVSGYNAFLSLYTVSLRVGGTPLEDPPSSQPPKPLNAFFLEQVNNDISISFPEVPQFETHDFLVDIYRTGPISTGKKPDTHKSSIIATVAADSTPYVDSLTESGRYGYWLRVVDKDTGEVTPKVSNHLDFVWVTPDPGDAFIGGYTIFSGTPQAGVRVRLKDSSFNILDFTYSDETGYYSFDDLTSQFYNLAADAGEWGGTASYDLSISEQKTNLNITLVQPP